MTALPADSVPRAALPARQRRIAFTRAGAAVLWAVGYFAALHGQRVLSGSDIPVLAGLLLAAYPVIDAVATAASERVRGQAGAKLPVGVVVDGLAVVALLGTMLGAHTRAVLVAFGAWAFLSGALQLASAWRAEESRRVQLPLIVSGAISALAGITFAAMAGEHVAQLSYLGGYALLGAVFFLTWTAVDRRSSRAS